MSEAALTQYARRLRALKTLAPESAKATAPLLEKAIRETAAAGVTADGTPWPTKKDGTRALPNAASAITATAKGVAVIVKLSGAYVFHHRSKGENRRAILPDSGAGLPDIVRRALQEGSRRAFLRGMRR